uniref:Adenylyl-sulfate kinase n=3 Tax=Agrobacterium tumefaciens complex TaxID=1183400 RepID=A0A2Z2PTU2_9HYPH|nr:adenylyl-sulfate kinase [Agrobacterium radiobacter]ASK44052.1 adenylyl-sulfate kinase [Agrobacterium fabrum]ASK46424.1 adenylyl-sulfate kinase [Agrobacterium fabrum]NSY04770.1 adenylyl-sulfate kinase [Agrobacterium tumefaciens]
MRTALMIHSFDLGPQSSETHNEKLDRSISRKGADPGAVIWLTGLSGSGKSTVAVSVDRILHERGRSSVVLDGDIIRRGLSKDLGFEHRDRYENVRRIAEVAKLLAEAGFTVLVSCISPLEKDRQSARRIIAPVRFLEVFVETPIEECIRRDPKGLYRKALSGEIKNFTGISSPYEAPLKPDLCIRTADADSETLAALVVRTVCERGDAAFAFHQSG